MWYIVYIRQVVGSYHGLCAISRTEIFESSLLYVFLSQSLITLENIPTYTEVCVCWGRYDYNIYCHLQLTVDIYI